MAETSELLGIPMRTLSRRWSITRVKLYQHLLSDQGENDGNQLTNPFNAEQQP